MTPFSKEFAEYCTKHGTPERLELMLCDINGILRGKWIPGEAAAKLDKGAAKLPISTYAPNIFGEELPSTGLGITVGDPDGILVPICGSLRPTPWANGHAAQVQMEMIDADTDEIGELSTRQLLANMRDRLAEKNLFPVIATELEFYLFKPRASEDAAPTPIDRSPDAQNYDLEVLERAEKILEDIASAAKEQGIDTDTLIAEYGPGQFEINFHHTDDVLYAADTALWFKRLVRNVARTHCVEATFMAKPYADHPGNGMHAHISVLDQNGDNIFNDNTGSLSENLKHAVAGTLETMRDLQAIFSPHMNSYRRFKPLSFAPSAPDWGFDNRAAGVRIPEVSGPAARLEHRIAGADTNPYLVLTAILGGILYGLENKPDLEKPLDDPDATPAQGLSSDWAQTVNRFENAEIAKQVFGARFVDVFSKIRQDEITQLTHDISEIEYKTYLGRL